MTSENFENAADATLVISNDSTTMTEIESFGYTTPDERDDSLDSIGYMMAPEYCLNCPDDPEPSVEFADDATLTITNQGATEVVEISPDGTFEFTMPSSTDDDQPDYGKLGVPKCPECSVQDAVQLSTGEWVCSAEDCKHVWTDD